ncbi:hypothetical protein ACHHYP_07289 [Achlya hypogyna]|uniref:Secreted protein n=1 Tax=Achlya hypogyna TaxID=1202772 RepID=A0A0A7CNG1_ACHHY|nr:secreted protein [Achlya hypogyna]OQR88192.1 hypothetical protein ACHHYP_07289 [Achlya hypogyna]
MVAIHATVLQLLSSYFQLLPSSAADWALFAYRASTSAAQQLPASTGTTSGSPAPGPFHWQPCPDYPDDPRYQCGALTVPLDHLDATNNATLNIAVQKYTTGDAPSKGTILVNPGGPGGAGTEIATPMVAMIMGGQYDILGFDPRGIGKSRPIRCSKNEFTAAMERAAIAGIESPLGHGPITDAVFDNYASNYALPIARCEQYDGDYLPYLSTAFVARDMDLIRAALGQDLMHYYGVSYGSFLGITYANMFPDKVGRFVIDAVLDPELYTGSAPELMVGSFRDTDKIFEAFVTACEKVGPAACALADASATRPYLMERLQQFFAQVSRSPLLLRGGEDIVRFTDTDVRQLVLPHLYSPTRWSALATDLARLINGTFVVPPTNNSCETMTAPTDVDMAYQVYIGNDGDLDANRAANWTRALQRVQNATRVLFDPEMNNIVAVKYWKTRAVERYAGPWAKAYANKVVILNNELDPVCPLHSAQHVRALMGANHSVLVTREGYGHGAAVSQFSSCLHALLTNLYSNGTYPAEDTYCRVDSQPFDEESVPKEFLAAMSAMATQLYRRVV